MYIKPRSIELLTQDIERKSNPCKAEALKETQGAEHGDIDRKGHSQTKHQHKQHRYDQHWMSAKPKKERQILL